MTAPELHHNEFTNRDESPPMSAIERGAQIKIEYTPTANDPDTNGDDNERTVAGTVTHAGYGQFKDIIKFTPHHTDNTWKLELYKTGSALFYQHGDNMHDFRRVAKAHRDPTATIEEYRR